MDERLTQIILEELHQIKQDVRWLREREEGRLLAAREKVEESMAAFERIGCAKR
jgi:hypothetical protein